MASNSTGNGASGPAKPRVHEGDRLDCAPSAGTSREWRSGLFEDIAREQDGVFRLDEVASLITWAAADHAVRSGKWRKPHRGVYAVHNSELTDRQERWVCLLAGPPGSALGGLTAARLDGLQGFDVPEIYLVVPISAR